MRVTSTHSLSCGIAHVSLCACGDRGCGNTGVQLAAELDAEDLPTLVEMLQALPDLPDAAVVTDTGSLAVAVKDLDSGFVVPVSDPVSLASALDRLVTMTPAERRSMGARGRAAVLECLNQRRSVDAIASVYRSLV